jgi:hypothetical protein
MNIILWIISSLMWSLWWTYGKKASDHSTLPNWLFVLFWPLTGLIVIYSLIFILWINTEIFSNYYIILLLIIAWIIDWCWTILEASIYKKIKISKILPYTSFDKLFIILIWFVLFYWNPWYTSIPTLIIALVTVWIIILFSIDYNNLKIEKEINLYIFVKLLYAISTLIIWSVLLSYTTMDMIAVIVFVYLSFFVLLNIFLKKDLKQIFKQTKSFYRYRLLSSITGRWSFIIWILIIESSWVLIASLLSFITIVFSILSMKFILWDSPTKKQVFLAISVIILIWIWFYFN